MSTTTAIRAALAEALNVTPGELGTISRHPQDGHYEVQIARLGMIVPVYLDDAPADDDDDDDTGSVVPAGGPDAYDDMTVAQLDEILAARGLPKTGRQADKVERLEADDAARLNPTVDDEGADD